MAHIHLNYYSNALKLNTDAIVVIPTPNSDELMNNKPIDYWHSGAKYQVLYLLHGTYGDYQDWNNLTSIERYAQDHKLMVVMPSCANSWFLDMEIGPKYFTFLTEELPEYIEMLFPASPKAEDRFIAGLSMGGYGAWHTALAAPEKYAASASLSGALNFSDIAGAIDNYNGVYPFPAIFGGKTCKDLEGSDADIFVLLKKLKESGAKMPKLYFCDGTEDFLYPSNCAAHKKLDELGIEYTYEEGPGIHDWIFWDHYIQNVLNWLPLKNTTV